MREHQFGSSLSTTRRLFDEAIPTSSIAESLVSFDDTCVGTVAAQFMRTRGFDVVGVRRSGLTVGYTAQSEVGNAALCDYLHAFEDGSCLPDRAPLLASFQVLRQHDRVFVTYLGHVAGIITRGDLQKAPVRMWFFNLVSLLEIQMLRLIRQHYPGGEWRGRIKPGRVSQAERLLADRQRRNEAIDLADCLEFCDKATILLRTADCWRLFGESRAKAKRFLDDARLLRDDLAHAQDIVTSRWPKLVDLAQELESALDRNEAAAEPSDFE